MTAGRKRPATARQRTADQANIKKASAAAAKRPRTGAQLSAARSNIKKAIAASAAQPRTARQLAASHRNILKAIAAEAGRPRTARQLAADRANLVKARAVEATRPRTAKQLAASRANLVKARAALRARAAISWHRRPSTRMRPFHPTKLHRVQHLRVKVTKMRHTPLIAVGSAGFYGNKGSASSVAQTRLRNRVKKYGHGFGYTDHRNAYKVSRKRRLGVEVSYKRMKFRHKSVKVKAITKRKIAASKVTLKKPSAFG